MMYKEINIKISYPKDKVLSVNSHLEIENKVEEFVNDLVEMHSQDQGGLVGSGYNFITKQRDYHIEVGFDKS